jgi:hypothetical protein
MTANFQRPLWNTQVQQNLTHSWVDGMRRCGLFTLTLILPPTSFVTVTITYMGLSGGD